MEEIGEGSSSNDNVMVEIILNYGNEEFKTYVTPMLLKVLEEDENFFKSYAKLVYEREFGQNQKENNVQASVQANEKAEANTQKTSALEEEKAQWLPKSTLLLIETRLLMEKDFIKPSCSKKKLWKIVAETLNKNKYKVTEAQCDSKYRNLLHTYRTNKKKQQSTGEGSITWEYFEQFDRVLGHKESSHPSGNNLGASMLLEQTNINSSAGELLGTDSKNNVSEESFNENQQNVPLNPPPPKKRRLEILSMGRYLYLKNERMEDIERKKQQFRQEKWQEEKELRRKEIESINRLAEALQSSKE